jgi:hypothetical protein
MTVILRGIDTSFDDVSLEEARRIREAGFEVAWQCLWTGAQQPPPRVTNLRNYMNAGMIVMGYASLPQNATDGVRHMDAGRAGVPDDIWAALVRVAVDVELTGIMQAAIRQAIDRLVAVGKSLKTIYTSWNVWVNYLGNPTTFTDCDLINAWWDEDEDRDFDHHPYGGWTPEQVIAEQYTGGSDVLGVYADKDVFYVTRERLIGQPATAVVEASTGLLQLRIAWLEKGMRTLLDGKVQDLIDLGRFYGGK